MRMAYGSEQAARADCEFWEDRPLDEILREQGIQPTANPRDLAIDWPDDDLDEFFEAVREARR